MTPAIAPLAPMLGMLELALNTMCVNASRHSAKQVEKQVSKVPEVVLDVVAEQPEHPHVADNVPPASREGTWMRGSESCAVTGLNTGVPVSQCDLCARYHAKLCDECVQYSQLRTPRK